MREVASPVGRTLVAKTEFDADFEVLLGEDLARARLVDVLRLAVDQQLELGRAVLRDERDRDLSRVDLKARLRVADGAEDPTPVGVLAVQSALDEARSRDGRRDLVRALVGRCPLPAQKCQRLLTARSS